MRMRRGKKKGKSSSYCVPFPIRLLLKAFNTENKKMLEVNWMDNKKRSVGAFFNWMYQFRLDHFWSLYAYIIKAKFSD